MKRAAIRSQLGQTSRIAFFPEDAAIWFDALWSPSLQARGSEAIQLVRC